MIDDRELKFSYFLGEVTRGAEETKRTWACFDVSDKTIDIGALVEDYMESIIYLYQLRIFGLLYNLPRVLGSHLVYHAASIPPYDYGTKIIVNKDRKRFIVRSHYTLKACETECGLAFSCGGE